MLEISFSWDVTIDKWDTMRLKLQHMLSVVTSENPVGFCWIPNSLPVFVGFRTPCRFGRYCMMGLGNLHNYFLL